jgi:pseudouridine kinase
VAAAAAGDGVDLSAVGRSTLHPTATYTAVLGPDGELVVGIAATEIYDTLDDLWAQMALRRARRSAVVVIDANLPETVIDAIVGGLPETTLLAADPVSVPKAARLRPVLDRLDVLFAGVDEAAELAGAGGDAHELAGRLAGSGPRAVVVTDSARGAVLADAGGVARHPAVPSSVVDVTGAGDALVAGFLFAVLGGEARPIGWGLAAAGLAVESPPPVPDRLDAATLAARVGGGGAEGVRL